jgi:molybdopterin/thiamine biosynthesis adenylyltransferase
VIDHEPDDAEAVDLVRRVDLVMSCPADFEHRLRLNWAAYQAEVPLIDAAQWGMTGSLIVSDGRSTPCLACAYPDPPPFEEKFPVLGAIAGAMGNLAALEAIKILSGSGSPAWGRLLIVDGFWGQVRCLKLTHRESCPICGPQPPATGEKRINSSSSTSVRSR